MRGTLATAARTFAAALAIGLAACSDDTTAPLSPEGGPRRLTAGGSALLASSVSLTPGTGLNSVTYTVTMPSSGPIRLSFDGRIDWPYTAGNSTVLEVLVNGIPVTTNYKSYPPSYYYANQGRTEAYYANRGSAWGQPGSLWGLFWSPDFSQNNNPSDWYYVNHGSAYLYNFTISALVNYGQTNNITLRNLGNWVTVATGNTPNVILQSVTLRNF
jgi:hypothetical protein